MSRSRTAATPRAGVGALAGGLVAALGAAIALLGGPTPAAHADDAPQPTARITLSAVGPDLVTATSTVRVVGTITNTGDQLLDDVTVRLRPVDGRLGTRADVAAWLSGDDPRAGVPVTPTADLAVPLGAGASAGFTLEVPATRLGLTSSPFGVYPVAVDARARPDGGARDQVAFTRTTLQWQPPTKQYAAQQIAWLVPFTGLPGTNSDVRPRPADVAAAVAPGSRLRHVLDAASAPGVAWAVDPQLLTSLQEVATASVSRPTATQTASPSTTPGSGASASVTSPPQAATPTDAATTPSSSPTPDADAAARAVVRDYLSAMRAAAAGRDVIELPYADTDLEPVSDAGAMQLVEAARAAGAGTITEVLGVAPRTDVAWPAHGYASDHLVKDLSNRGIQTLVLDARTRPLVEALSYTTDARAELPSGSTAVLFDPELSALAARVRPGDATSRSRFLAETAAATTERPGLSRRLLVALPRTVDPQPAAFRDLVTSAAAVPWLDPISWGQLVAPLGTRGDTSSLPRRAAAPRAVRAPAGITRQDVALTLELRARLSALGEVVDDPVRTTAQLQRTTLTLVSSVWRGNRSALTRRQRLEASTIETLVNQLRVLPTTITFLRSSGELQLTVSNDLPEAVHGVRLRVVAPSPRLVVSRELSEPLDLAAGSRASVRVPVRALASGQVDLQAQLVAPSGSPIGETEHVKVRVRPTDSWVLTVGGVVAGLVVVVGLVRALRRPRRRVEG
ncbi:DUF6049 family protein [Angustibacter sp. Root456]|uniref:DUF6049 family protein n=1 Tax=Angustibacter sp. Root456 TaxID=1736539 RepID=UPI0006F919EE|nr:DUF6049 family protein [Angustibacter sp. Root456]KQX61875.1 hypothetical protein ASD06_15105 [Angustibacter sp. Root456]